MLGSCECLWLLVVGWDVGVWGGRVGRDSVPNPLRNGTVCAGRRGRRGGIVCLSRPLLHVCITLYRRLGQHVECGRFYNILLMLSVGARDHRYMLWYKA